MSANTTTLFLVPAFIVLLALPASAAEPSTPADATARRDAWGDLLPPGVLFRTGTVRALHHVSGQVCFSPDRKLLAATGSGHTIQIWDLATGKEVRTFQGHDGQVMDLHFSADGKTLVSASRDKTVRLWEVDSGKETGCFTGHERDVWCAVLSPCGTWVAASDCHEIRFWDRQTGKQTRLISSGADTMFHLVLSADGKLVAVESHDTSIRIWETATGKPLNQFKKTESKLEYPYCFLSENKTLLTHGHGGGVTLWDIATAKKIRQFETGYPIAISKDGNVVAIGEGFWRGGERSIRLWDLTTGQQVQQLRGHGEGGISAAFSPDGNILISLGRDRTLRRWNLKTGEELDPPIGHQHAVRAIAFSPDGKRLASGSDDRTLRLWNPLTGREVRQFRSNEEVVQGIAFLRDGNTLLSQNDVVPPGQPNWRTEDTALTRVRLWDVATGQERRHFDHRKAFIHVMAFSPRRHLLAQGGYKTVRLLDPTSGKQLPLPKTDQHRIEGMAFSPEGNLLAVTSDESGIRETTYLRLYNLVTGKECWHNGRTFESYKDVVFSPDGKLVVTGGAHIRLWDAGTGKEIGSLKGGHGHLAFSPDGRTLATCGDGHSVVLWEVATGRERRRFAGHDISCMAFSPDGRLLATGGLDTLVMVWDVTGRMQEGHLRTGPADDKSLESVWARLGDGDAAVAYEAAWSLVSSPNQTIQFVRERLPFMAKPDPKQIGQLIADLDNPEFAVRRRATELLENLGPAAADALRGCLEEHPSLETRRRAERLLQMSDGLLENSALRRGLRLVEVLEQIGTTEARHVIRQLADRALVPQLRAEAKSTMLRLERSSRASLDEETGETKRPDGEDTAEREGRRRAELREDGAKVAATRDALPRTTLDWAVIGAVALMAIGVLLSRRRSHSAVRNSNAKVKR